MCFGAPPPTAMNMPAPIKERNPDLAQESQLAKPKKVVDDEKKVTGVEYGNQKKPVDVKTASSDALRIKLNTGTQTASASTGGLNV